MSVPSSINSPVSSDSTSAVDRNTFYENCFMIDGVAMPIPSEWEVSPQILTRDSKRKISTGALWAPYICTVYTVTWKYKYLSSKEYRKLYEAYVKSVATNGSIKHYIATMDSNEKNRVFATPAYTENNFKAPLYKIDPITRKHHYKDVTLTMVSLGGADNKTNYFTKKSSFQDASTAFNYNNYVDKISNRYASEDIVDNTVDSTDE